MVLQHSQHSHHCNVWVQKLDHKINNNVIDSYIKSEYELNVEEYFKNVVIPSDVNQSIEALFTESDAVLFDCDKLLMSDPNNNDINEENTCHISQSIELIESLRKLNKKIILTSNRSDITRQQMLIQLNSLGINGSIKQMFPSSYTTAVYLKAIGFERQVLVVGSDAIRQELHEVGIQSIGLDQCSHSTPNTMNEGFATFNLNPKVGAVVVSLDRTIPLPHLVKACSYATKPDCIFIVANYNHNFYDESEPRVDNMAAIRVAANKGFISLDKFHRLYFHCIRQIHTDFDSNRAVLITGTNSTHSTNTCFAKNIAIKTILIETEFQKTVKSKRIALNANKGYSQHYYLMDSMSSFLSSLNSLLSK